MKQNNNFSILKKIENPLLNTLKLLTKNVSDNLQDECCHKQ